MTMLAYLGHNAHPTPPVIEPGRTGNISRYCHDQRIAKPLQHAPVVLTLAQINEAKHDKNREKILGAIKSGISRVTEIAEAAEVNTGTVWNHIRPLEKDGVVAIDRVKRPWAIKLAKGD